MPVISRAATLPPVRTNRDAAPVSTIVKFPEDWQALPSVRASSTVRFELPAEEVAKSVKGDPAKGWRGTLCYSVNGSEPVRVNFGVHGPEGWQRSHPVEVEIPRDAQTMSFWLELSGAGGPSYYSNWGRNFTMNIEGRSQALPPAPYHPPPNSQVSDRWGHIIGWRSIDAPTPVVVINPSLRSDRRGQMLARSADADGKIEWR